MHRPVRPAQNLRDFANRNHWLGRTEGWPCLTCYGRGLIAHAKYEDYEVSCAVCGGTGEGTKEDCRQAYKAAIRQFHQQAQTYNRLIEVRRQALACLTQEQIYALRKLGL